MSATVVHRRLPIISCFPQAPQRMCHGLAAEAKRQKRIGALQDGQKSSFIGEGWRTNNKAQQPLEPQAWHVALIIKLRIAVECMACRRFAGALWPVAYFLQMSLDSVP